MLFQSPEDLCINAKLNIPTTTTSYCYHYRYNKVYFFYLKVCLQHSAILWGKLSHAWYCWLKSSNHPQSVRHHWLVIFILVQLTPRSSISSSSNWTSSVVESEVNRSILRLSTQREEPLSGAKESPQTISHMHGKHNKSSTDIQCYTKMYIAPTLCRKGVPPFCPASQHHAEIQHCTRERKPQHMHLSQISALLSVKWCTTIAALPQL